MVTFLVGTDGEEASETLALFLNDVAAPDDRVEVVHVLTNSDVDAASAGEEALTTFESVFDVDADVRARQLNRGRSPAEEMVAVADSVDADRLVTGLRQHSRTERIISGSVSQSLVKRVDRPVTLVPLPSYTVADEEDIVSEPADE
ncbi:universal stress protein [Halosegnis sp.]|uniref:universal stress protein n=1 Tax=Halosegnis sp. TaxID=2864959 RepID=UPI0035D42F6F